MAVQRGRKVRLEVAYTYGPPKTVTEVTNANPGVASSTGHGLVAGTIGYFATATGMESELEDGMAISVKAPTTDAFTLEGVDTTDWGNFTAGSFVPVATWKTLSEATDYAKTGGAQKRSDRTVLLDSQDQEETVGLTAESVSVSHYSNPSAEALAFVEAAARASEAAIFRITFDDGERRVWRGVPDVPSDSMGKGALGTGSFTSNVIGRFLSLAAAA